MIQHYFKQAWVLIKQNRLYTFIYIAGTGLAIALTMTIFIIFYIKLAPVYPEYNRAEILVLKRMLVENEKEGNQSSSSVSYALIRDVFPHLKHLKQVAAIYEDADSKMIDLPDQKEPFFVKSLCVNADFWQVFTFDFMAGKPFSEADVSSVLHRVVISESLARRIFATVDVVGKHFSMDADDYQVCGVVKDVSSATPVTAADIWLPLTLEPQALEIRKEGRMLGPLSYYMIPEEGQKETLRSEIENVFRTINAPLGDWQYDLMGQPDDYWLSTFRVWSNQEVDLWDILKNLGITLLALILIPAMNLSGMISSRMGHRLGEMGVRKAFGATRFGLVKQLLWENLLLTCLGGLVGLFLSYIIMITASDWILTLFDSFVEETTATSITFEMLFNPAIFIIAFGICIVLNFISALIPTIWALRHSIVYSLTSKR